MRIPLVSRLDAFWDNRCTRYNPIKDYHGYRREMHRVTLSGDKTR
jgi:taurine dioxygenase